MKTNLNIPSSNKQRATSRAAAPRRRNLLLLALTLLSLAATLPMLADLNYLKNNYTYREKVPIKSVTSNVNNGQIQNLTDDKDNTVWTSWEVEHLQTFDGYNDFNSLPDHYSQNTVADDEISIENGILSYVRYADGNKASTLQNRILTTGQTLNLSDGEYKVKLQLTANKTGELKMELAGRTATAIVNESSNSQEVEFDFGTFDSPLSNAECKLDASLYSGSLNITSAKLLSKRLLASTHSGEWNVEALGDDISGTPKLDYDKNLLAGQARHFNIIEGITIDNQHSYRIWVRIKKEIATEDNSLDEGSRVIVNLGTWGNGNDGSNSKYLTLSDEWTTQSVVFTPEDLTFATKSWASIYCWDNAGNPNAFKSNIYVDWAMIEDITDSSDVKTIKAEDYSGSGFSCQNWDQCIKPTIIGDDTTDKTYNENNNKVLFSAVPPVHFKILNLSSSGKNVTLDSSANYKIILKLKGSKDYSEDAYVNLGDNSNGRSNNEQGKITFSSQTQEFTLNYEPGEKSQQFCSIYCPNASGDITVESVELYDRYGKETILSALQKRLDDKSGYGDWGANSEKMVQFSILPGLDLDPSSGKNYLVSARVKGSTAKSLDFAIGGDGWSDAGPKLSFTPEWTEQSIIIPASKLTNVKKITEVRLQPFNYVGKLEIDWVKICAVAWDGNDVATLAEGDPTYERSDVTLQASDATPLYAAATLSTSEEGTSLSSTPDRVNAKFYVFKDIDLIAGTYSLTMNYAASANGTVRATLMTPNGSSSKDYSFNRWYELNINEPQIGVVTVPEDDESIKGDLIFEIFGENGGSYNGNFDIKDIKLTANKTNTVRWNYVGQTVFQPYAMSYKPLMENDRMVFIQGWRRFNAMTGLDLQKGNKYKLIARIKGEKEGKITVKLGGVPHEFEVTTEYKDVNFTYEMEGKPKNKNCEIIRPEDEGDPGKIWIDYIGFEDVVTNLDNVLNTTLSAANYEADLLKNVSNLEKETLYGITARLAYSGSVPNFQICYSVEDNGVQKKIQSTTPNLREIRTANGLTEVELRAEFPRGSFHITETLKDQKGNDSIVVRGVLNGGAFLLDVSNHSESQTLQVKSVKLWKPTREFHSNEGFETGHYISGRTPGIANEELYITVPPSWGEQFIVKDNLDFKVGANYKLKVWLKSSTDCTFGAHLGNWDKMVDVNNINVPAGEETQYTIVFPTNYVSNGMITFGFGNSYQGKLEIGAMELSYDDSEYYLDFSKMTENSSPCPGFGDYPDPIIAMAETQSGKALRLQTKPYYKPFKVTNELSFNSRYRYTVTAKVKPTNPGIIKVMLGNDEFRESISYTFEDNTEKNIKLGPFPSLTASEGYLMIRPDVDPDDPSNNVDIVTVKEVKISYTLKDTNGKPLASDYFDVTLDYPLAADGKYAFHIGYDTYTHTVKKDGKDVEQIDPEAETPTKFIVQGKISDDTYLNLGQYTLTPDVSDPGNAGHMFIDTSASPLAVKDNSNITELRFICTDNVGHEAGIVQDGENYAEGYKLRINRFGVYKLTDFLNTDNAKLNNWVVPVITRFQIESMGQRYAYPGPRLRDMIGVGKTKEIAGQLFDADPSTYWDTTLPYNVEKFRRRSYTKTENGVTTIITEDKPSENVTAEGAQNRNYTDDNITDKNDYIDIILPQFNNKVKKYNGNVSADNNAKQQVVIVLKRADDEIIGANVNRSYVGLDGDGFVNKSNGFPLEIRYQGIKRAESSQTANTAIENSVDGNMQIMRLPYKEAGDSIAFALDFKDDWEGIRLFCVENTGQTARKYGDKTIDTDNDNAEIISISNVPPVEDKDTRIFRVSEIRAYMELPKVNMDNATSREDFAKLYNNRENFNTYGWNHTQGIIDDINNARYDAQLQKYDAKEAYMKKGPDGQTWQNVIADNEKFFKAQNLAYPEFKYLDNPTDDEDVVPSYAGPTYTAEGDNKNRQRTYTVLHEVYALPGERVDLYPYSDIWNNQTGYNYEDQFVRWYDYLTDAAPSYLYFFSDPKSVIKSDSKGFFGGKTLLDHGYRGRGSVASIYFNKALYDDAEKESNGKSTYEDRYYYKLDDGTLRMKDQWVAADFSLTFNTNLAQRLGKDAAYNNKADVARAITEPIVTFRHLFHIQSASVFADNYMSSAEKNQAFFTSNRRYVSTFANKTFNIRLEEAMPLDANTKASYYYRKTTKGDDGQDKYEYEHVYGYEIFTYYMENPQDGKSVYDELAFKLTGQTDEIEVLHQNSIDSKIDGRMFEPDNNPFTHINSDIQTTVPTSNWLRDGKKFARSIRCRKRDALPGKYKVRIYGKDKDGKIIRLKDEKNGDEWPLVVAEYDVEFLSDDRASFVPDEDIAEINSNPSHQYYSHMEKYLDRRYGSTADVKTVNFDQYTILKQDEKFSRFEFFDGNGTGSRLKLPITWSHSNYGFGYTTGGDYNMFRLADHSSITPYKHAAEAKKDNPYDAEYKTTQTGTYDRLFYNSGGKEKGLFYYVNAASDPGEMVRIDFDYLCPGSTIYVSAWVNEFNDGQPETANVIFNFYGNVAKTNSSSTHGLTREGEESGTSTTQKILRTEQLHGFATGYVKRNPQDDYENGIEEGGDQGKWMHVFYTFMPDKSHADLKDDEEIVSYSLVLENNSVSSKGADYAIDDVRAYVVAPQVYAEQKGALCQKDDVDIEIQVQLPLEALIKSIANQGEGKNDVVKLQYSIVDKTKYDDKLEDIKEEKGDDYTFTTDDYYAAFAAGVLHYPHDNIEGASGVNQKPTSWGTIDFYPNYNTQSDTQISGSNQTIGQYMNEHIETIEGVDCFTFITTPVALSSDGSEKYNEFKKTHHNYYIVVDNLGVNSIFTDVKGEDGNKIVYGEGQTNADVYPVITNKAQWPDYDKELAKAYQWCSNSNCDRKAEFSLKGAAQIVVDGMLYDGGDEITCCENQRPVVQINLKNKLVKSKNEKTGEYDLSKDMSMVDNEATINPYLDWYVGPFEDFAAKHKVITVMKDGIQVQQDTDLWEVLDAFREDYPKSDTWNVPVVGQKDDKGNDLPTGEVDSNGNPKLPRKYTSDMRDWLKELTATSKIENDTETEIEPKLFLHQSSFIFPQSQTKLDKGEWSKEIYATAIPTVYPEEIKLSDDKTYVICTQPKEVKITVTNTSPEMFNGFNGMTYPASIEDVPLRVGLKDLDRVAKESNTLFVPLRKPVPATDDVTDFQVIPDKTANDITTVNNYVYLVETNDPHYRQISDFVDTETKPATPAPTEGSEGTETSDNSEGNAGNADKKKDDIYVVDTRIAGKVANIVANFEKGENGEVTVSGTPMAQIKFFDDETSTSGNKFKQGITFREGYYYKFKFNFEEAESPSMAAAGYEEKCKGQTVFTIKVVPEYQQWTGNASLNWNNDENWTRVSKTQLLADSETPSGIKEGLSSGVAADERFTTTGSNNRTFSYAPLDFTKVIIPAGATYPQLAERRHSNTATGAASGASTVPVDNGYASAPSSYVWATDAPNAATAAGNSGVSASENVDGKNYQPTLNIQYDMAAVTYTDNNNVYCRPWYANACEQIHFNSNAEILNQQNLDYEKAWVDMEMTPHRWYTVASPLYGVVAGDMYLPKADGRQATELFKDITFNTTLNDRFAPAVYQRGWDKGSETVYNLTPNSTNCPNQETVALSSTWSHVYNDVADNYTVGAGYSVKTDVTRLPKYADDYTGDDKQTYVKFRFPKADESYKYFTDGSGTGNAENGNELPRGNKVHKLYNFETPTGKNAGDVILKKNNDANVDKGKLFLVGNPFMAHLDMKEFLDGNSSIQRKFWIMSGDTEIAVQIDADGKITATGASPEEVAKIAPMQGFFVEATSAAKELTVHFTPEMMAVQGYDTETNTAPILKTPGRRQNENRATRNEQRATDNPALIRVSTDESTAIIRLNAAAQKGYAASEDVEMIDDSNQRDIRRVYTIAGNMASAINQTPDADGVEIGLMAPADSVTVVTLHGQALEDYLLYDIETGETTPLYDGFEIEMKGAVNGRYFLTSGVDTSEIEDGSIRIEPQGGEIVVTAPAGCGELTACVYDTLGRLVAKAEGFEQEMRIAVSQGVYVVDVRGAEHGRRSAKININ